MPSEFPIDPFRKLSTDTSAKKEAERNLKFSYDMLVSNVKRGDFASPAALETVKLGIQRAKEVGVDVSEYEASIPDLTKKVWRIFTPRWIEILKKQSYINQADFDLTMDSSLRSVQNGIKDTSPELFDSELIGLLRDLTLAIDAVLEEAQTKGYDTGRARQNYDRLIEAIKVDRPPLDK